MSYPLPIHLLKFISFFTHKPTFKYPFLILGIGDYATSVLILLTLFLFNQGRIYAQRSQNVFPQPKHGSTYVIAHRGAHRFAPENSLLAYRKAIEMGCDFVEIDLRKTKDGRFVSVHNNRIDAYFDHESGKVNDFTLAELKNMPLRMKSDDQAKEYIPTFEEILTLCKNRIGIYLDLKEPDIKSQVQIVKDFDMQRQIIWYIPASYRKAIRQLKRYCSECLVMPDPGPGRNVLNVIKNTNPKVLATDMGHLNARFVEQAHENGVKVFVDDDSGSQEEWRQILDWGTDGIQTDNPRDLIDFINKTED